MHERAGIPLNLHLSGTLIEAIAWHEPGFLPYVRELVASGLVEVVGSCYGQNIMRFFGPEYNRRQFNEELLLFELHLAIDPSKVKTFWPPERVWDTRRMAPVLRDARLRNSGYQYVILDDRLLLAQDDETQSRATYDETNQWDPDLYTMHEIKKGLDWSHSRLRHVCAEASLRGKMMIGRRCRVSLEALLVHATGPHEEQLPLLAVYADDMEKVAGVGEWGGGGPAAIS